MSVIRRIYGSRKEEFFLSILDEQNTSENYLISTVTSSFIEFVTKTQTVTQVQTVSIISKEDEFPLDSEFLWLIYARKVFYYYLSVLIFFAFFSIFTCSRGFNVFMPKTLLVTLLYIVVSMIFLNLNVTNLAFLCALVLIFSAFYTPF